MDELKILLKNALKICSEEIRKALPSLECRLKEEDYELLLNSIRFSSNMLRRNIRYVKKLLKDLVLIERIVENLVNTSYNLNHNFLQAIAKRNLHLRQTDDAKKKLFLQLSGNLLLTILLIVYDKLAKKEGKRFSALVVTREGFGKSIVSTLFLRYLYSIGEIHARSPVLVIAGNSVNLVKEWKERKGKYMPFLKKLEIKTLSSRKFKFKEYEFVIIDEAENLLKRSAIKRYRICRNAKKNGIIEIVNNAKRVLILLPTSYEKRKGQLKSLIKNKEFNPLTSSVDFQPYEYKVFEPIIIKVPPEVKRYYLQIQRDRRRYLKLAKQMLLKRGATNPDPTKICEEDAKELGIEGEEYRKLCYYVYRFKAAGTDIRMFFLSHLMLPNLLQGFKPFYFYSLIGELEKIIRNSDGKILIYSQFICDLDYVKRILQERTKRKVCLWTGEHTKLKDSQDILVISDVGKEGINLNEFNTVILFRYPRTSLEKLKNLISRSRGASIYIIGFSFEERMLCSLYKKLKEYFEGGSS